jgi:cell division transport system permease protein
LLEQRRRSGIEAALIGKPASIVPRDGVTSRALLTVIAIMTFVAALIIGVVGFARDAATQWRSDMVREMTIQIRPVQGRDQAAEIAKAVEIARRTPGVSDARPLTRDETGKLLEPWLGTGLDLGALPLPRLVVVQLSETAEPDLAGLRRALGGEVPGASLDDHRTWTARLATVSESITWAGIALLALVLIATMLSVTFATRGAVATNRAVVEVLHLVGARDTFIATTFQRHFIAVGLQGGLIGGCAAAFVFALVGIAPKLAAWMYGSGTAFFTGQFSLGGQGYAEIAGIVALVTLATALASRLTVQRTLREID